MTVAIPYEPTEAQLEAVGLAWRQDGEMMYCCEMGEHYYPARCPLHGMKGEYVRGPRYVDPLTISADQFEREWETS